jgi:Family of unknown function (DUF5990)
MRLHIRIEGTDLPGRSCGGLPGFPHYENVHVGVGRRGRPAELLGLVPGDAPCAAWDLECTAARTGTGADVTGVDITGPHIQGRPGDRFVYLSWVTVAEGSAPTVFRRAKLMLGAVDPAVLDAALDGGRLTARLGLTDGCGHPLCARVVPPRVEWSATSQVG